MMKKKIVFSSIAILTIMLLIVGFRACKKEHPKIVIETVLVKRGSVSNTITATGTLQAIKTVSVGTQVSGVIDKIYVDFNTHVKSGQLLAQLDTRTLRTSLENAEANLENANAEVALQTANFNRIKALTDKSLVAQSDYDQALYNFTKAQATLKTTKLEYNRANINLNYASISSPIDGVVLERAVDEGQTVAASFSTPTLFSIANDLTQMQVEASIDEADIGKITMNQRVTFTVDAFADRIFNGNITQIRFKPVTKSNVVTYTVIIRAPNPDTKLMPGMTASITVYVDEAANALIIPSKALHFMPDMALLQQYMQENSHNNPPHVLPPMPETMGNEHNIDPTAKNVWVKEGEMLHLVRVSTGIDDDLNAQILSGLKEGDTVVLSMSTPMFGTEGQPPTPSGSPFMPKPPTRKSGSKAPKF